MQFRAAATMSDTLHVVPGLSAAGSLRQAVRAAESAAEIIGCPDDLSFGPIDSDAASSRAAWWSQFHDGPDEIERELTVFWSRVTETVAPIVLWIGRRQAMEYAFALAFADRMGARPYGVIDVSDHEYGGTLPDGSRKPMRPRAVSALVPSVLQSLLGTERPIAEVEVRARQARWQQLKRESAPFRVVSGIELVSAPIDHFDKLLLRLATAEWRREARIVGEAMGSDEPLCRSATMH